ncbi:TPA: CopG family transcriptional regulator [Streptococcus suis]|nr:CopG family transcriptional regulator [Streptococcus suis]HEM4702142.1 CopG family transcriptional regulator [Streptococcus suis]HEM4718888.1 CopG family transcriptional regulator [Streptococcus suis]HEM4719118.1 CopG family transcriptional regulator [Streptococcus suis]HEM4777609.1 CopG family transcriptional regulator [Streptococcus suis]
MATITPVSIRFDSEIVEALDEVTELTQISRSDFIRQAVIEKIEDMFDIKMADEAYQKWLDSGKKTYSFEEAMKRYG